MGRNRMTRITWPLVAALFLTVVASTPALAVDEQNLTSGLSAEGSPLALHGHDPVAYFTRGVATRGTAKHAVVHEGATYYFASADHKAEFEKNPAKYTPAFGGYCAFGVSVGKKFDGSPEYWTISNDRLYLNLNADIAKQFQKDVPGAVKKAKGQWKTIEHTATEDL